MVVRDAQPFKVMEDKGFRAFVQKLDPTHILATHQALQDAVENQEDKETATQELEKHNL